jgi:hypothetical protein
MAREALMAVSPFDRDVSHTIGGDLATIRLIATEANAIAYF